jgi:predicted porin
MKKSLIALAALAAVGAASAQSSVTLFGIVDATVAYGRGSVADKTQLTNSGYNTSRLGFRGTEDLGGGLSASFWLEAGFNNDDGTGIATNTNNQASGTVAAGTTVGSQGLTFNRRATVSLAGGFGELRLGRDYTPQFWNFTTFDPFGTNGAGASQAYAGRTSGLTVPRASNSIGYFLPANLGGIYGQAQYYLGENANNVGITEDDGEGYGLRVGYAAGPVNVAIGYGNTTNASNVDTKTTNIGGSYDFGLAKLLGMYNIDDVGGLEQHGWVIGALVPVGAGEIRASYSQSEADQGAEAKTQKLALGYVHNLSKRTAVYTTVARVKNSNGAAVALNGATTAANSNSTGFDLGLRHSF